MTEYNFKEMGYRRPTSRPHLDTLIEMISSKSITSEVKLDLRGCMFSYPFASLLEAVVNKIKKEHSSGKIVIQHGYRTVTPNHLINYLTKKTALGLEKANTLDELNKILLEDHNIELVIEESSVDA